MKKDRKPTTGPLLGVRILDLTRLYPGPLGTMLLADMGAEVIKIEDPNTPDYMRDFPPFIASESAGYLAVNRSKRSLALNFNEEKGKEIFFELVKTADIVVEQFRPGVLDKIGFGYELASEVNPRIIYVSVTGYGQQGPYAQRAGHDINYIGYAGILATTGTKESGPVLPAPQIADVAGGTYMTVIACLSALWARERTGKGQKVDVSMLDAVLPLMTVQMAHYWATRENPKRGEMLLSGGLACYGVYACADGKYIAISALEPKFWNRFCEMVGEPKWANQNYASGEEGEKLKVEVATFFKTKTRDEWISMANEHDFGLTPVLEVAEVEEDSHLRARSMFVEQTHSACGKIKGIGVPLKFSQTLAEPSWPPPTLGEDTTAILKELGYQDSEIKALQKKGVVVRNSE